MAGWLKQIKPKSSAIVHFQHDPEQCELTSGVGGWVEVARPRQVAGTEFTGTPLYKLTFLLVLDGYIANRSIESEIAQYEAWGQSSPGKEPAVLQLHYGNYDRLRWVMQDVAVTNTLRRSDMHRVQGQVQLTLLEYQGLTANRTAADSVRSTIIAVNTANGQTHKNPTVRTYTVVKGDTLQHIAARKLGNANRWKEIASLNKIKDPVHLHTGTKLKLPAT